MGDPVSDALMAQIMEGPDVVPEIQEVTPGLRVAAGIMAALSPESYQQIVAPFIQNRQQSIESAVRASQGERYKAIGALQALAGYQSVQEGRAARIAAEKERIAIARSEAERKAAEDAAELEETERENAIVESAFGAMQQEFGKDAEDVVGIAEALKATDNVSDAADARRLLTMTDGIAARITHLNDGPGYQRKDVDDLQDAIVAFRETKQDAITSLRGYEKEGREAQRELNKAALLAQQKLEEHARPTPKETEPILQQTANLGTVENVWRHFGETGVPGFSFGSSMISKAPRTFDESDLAMWGALQGVYAPIRSKLLGVAQNPAELKNVELFLGPMAEDPKVVRAAMSALSTLLIRDAKAQIDSLELYGRDVGHLRSDLFERYKAAPPLVQSLVMVPPNFPAGSVFMGHGKNKKKRIKLPSGRIVELDGGATNGK